MLGYVQAEALYTYIQVLSECYTEKAPNAWHCQGSVSQEHQRQETPTISPNDRQPAQVTNQAPGTSKRAAQEFVRVLVLVLHGEILKLQTPGTAEEHKTGNTHNQPNRPNRHTSQLVSCDVAGFVGTVRHCTCASAAAVVHACGCGHLVALAGLLQWLVVKMFVWIWPRCAVAISLFCKDICIYKLV